jgi:hypothetical protein
MEIINELVTEMIKSSDRTYFLHLSRAKNDSYYLSICESRHKSKEPGKYEQERVIIFEEDMKPFVNTLQKILKKYKELKSKSN